MGDGCCSATRTRIGEKGIGIKTLALERHKQVARLQGACVGVHTDQGRSGVPHQARSRNARLNKGERLLKGHHCASGGRDGLVSPCLQRALRMGHVRERHAHARRLLGVFVAFAGDQHHVGGRGIGNGQRNGRGAVGLGAHHAAGDGALQDLVHDGRGVFAAWVVAGHDDPVGLVLRHGAHQGALARVAVAAAAKHAPQLATTLLGHRAQGLQGLVQRVGRVGVVHGYQGLPRAVELLHAAGHR